MNLQLVIQCGPVEQYGKRLVYASLGDLNHRDKFDVDDGFKRRRVREKLICKFQLATMFHEFVESQIIAAANAQDGRDGPLSVVQTICMADVTPSRIDWFWENYFPAGAIHDSGRRSERRQIDHSGLDLASRFSRGDAMPPLSAPDGTFAGGNTLLIQGEDDPARTRSPVARRPRPT